MKDSISTLSIYLKEINKFPLLSQEQETKLAARASKGDKKAKDSLIKANLRFVVKIAKKYRYTGVDFMDLISEGNIGLMAAVDKYDANKGVRFISYAVYWIRQAITKYISDKGRTVHLPANRLNDIARIRNAAEYYSDYSQSEKIRKIASSLSLEKSYVREMLTLSEGVCSLDAPSSDNNILGDAIEENRYIAPEDSAVRECLKTDIDTTLSTLQRRESGVIKLRYGLDNKKAMSLEEVGKFYNLSKERVRQIEHYAIKKMKMPYRSDRLVAYVA